MISKETAMDIALAYREIETAEQLLSDIAGDMDLHSKVPDVRDVFGRLVGGLQLGVPSGRDSHRLYNVPWSLAKPVIEAHIAAQKSKIAALNAKAQIELDVYPNGKPKWAPDGTLLDDKGSRSIFDDIDK